MQLEMALSRATDPVSSHLAADEIKPDLERQYAKIMSILPLHPACTARELESYYLARHRAVIKFHKRLPELRKLGRVTNGDMRKCRISTKLAQTWSIA